MLAIPYDSEDLKPSVSTYTFALNPQLIFHAFEEANKEWLHFVASNRRGEIVGIETLLPNRLENQYCFRTQNAIDCLSFVEGEQFDVQ